MALVRIDGRSSNPGLKLDRSPRLAHAGGFTLIELLVAIAVAGILLAIAVPSFTSILISNRLTVTANDYVAALNAARVEAIKLNRPAQFCSGVAATNGSDALGTACGTSAASVYALNVDGSQLPVRNPTSLPPNILLGNGTNGGAMAALRYSDTGIASVATPTGSGPYSGLVVDVYSNKITTANHRCIYIATGSAISSCKLTDTTSTGCSASAPATCSQ